MENIEKYYTILELPTNASSQEVKKAYRDLSFVWHPDRFPEGKPELKQRAKEKLQEINEAYQILKEYLSRSTTSFSSTYSKQYKSNNTETAKRNRYSNKKNKQNEPEVLISQIGIDYTKLKFLLEKKDWKLADQETFNLIKKMRNLRTLGELPCEDLRLIDNLWREKSGNYYSLSIQKKVLETIPKYYGLSSQCLELTRKIGWGNDLFGLLKSYNYQTYSSKYITCKGYFPKKYILCVVDFNDIDKNMKSYKKVCIFCFLFMLVSLLASILFYNVYLLVVALVTPLILVAVYTINYNRNVHIFYRTIRHFLLYVDNCNFNKKA